MQDINIHIKGDYLKWFLYGALPAILLILNIVQFYYPHCTSWGDCDNNSTIEITAAATEVVIDPIPVVVEEQEEIVVVEEPEEEEVVDPPEEDETEEEIELSGNIELTLDKINYDNKGTWAKVISIEYTIDNQKMDFIPELKVYGYDDTYDDDMKGYIEETLTHPEIGVGNKVSKKSAVSITFNNLEEEKTIKLELYEKGKDKLLDTVTKTITLS